MKEFVERYRPLRQRTIREETTKGKTGALPLGVYTKRVVTPFQQRLKVTWKILELFHSRTDKKEFLLFQFST